jgi:hypothetical protein
MVAKARISNISHHHPYPLETTKSLTVPSVYNNILHPTPGLRMLVPSLE